MLNLLTSITTTNEGRSTLVNICAVGVIVCLFALAILALFASYSKPNRS